MGFGFMMGQNTKEISKVSNRVSNLEMFESNNIDTVLVENNGDKITVDYDDGSKEICNITDMTSYTLEQYDSSGTLIKKLEVSDTGAGGIKVTKV